MVVKQRSKTRNELDLARECKAGVKMSWAGKQRENSKVTKKHRKIQHVMM